MIPRDLPGFRITDGKGFNITFENGWTVSVQFGGGNACSAHKAEISPEANIQAGAFGCPDAEVAVWGPDGKLIDVEGQAVAGCQTPADVLRILNKVASIVDLAIPSKNLVYELRDALEQLLKCHDGGSEQWARETLNRAKGI